MIGAFLPVVLAALLAAPADSTRRTSADSSARPAPDSTTATDRYARYESLLADHLVVTSAVGQPLETRFDYIKLHDSVGRFGRMSRIRNDLLAMPPSKMSRPERVAWAINTYNFMVLELTTENLLDRNISAYLRVQGYSGVARNSVQQIQVDGTPFFEVPVVEIEGKSYNLNTFERQFVFRRDGNGEPLRRATNLRDFKNALGELPVATVIHHLDRGDYARNLWHRLAG